MASIRVLLTSAKAVAYLRIVAGSFLSKRQVATVFCAVILTMGLPCPAGESKAGSGAKQNPESVAKRILNKYEDNLFRLRPKYQGHFAIRMWRITGDTRYIRPTLFHYLVLKEQFIRQVSHLDSPEYIRNFSEQMLGEKFKTAKGKIRRKILELQQHQEFVFHKKLLELTYYINSLGMSSGDLLPQFAHAKDFLSKVNFKEVLLDSQIVRMYTPQAVNYVYYLKFLGLTDLEEKFIALFREIFRPGSDTKLDKIEYENMLYGLTHFIIAGSGYYQNYVSPEKYGWILEYLDKHINTILARSKPDVVAEVGLCFKLCGQKNHRVVALTKNKTVEAFDPKQGLIPPKKGKASLNKSEHRNAVAYLLLTDFDQLYPGPNLKENPELKYLFEGVADDDSD